MKGDYLSNSEEAKEYLPRYRLLYVVVALVGLIFTLRLWYLQIIQGQELREFSEKNRIKKNKVGAPRGLILDRNGEILVDNIPGFDATISPQYTDDLSTTGKAVAGVLGIDAAKVVSKVERSRKQNGPFFPVKIKENLSRDEVFRLKRIRIDNSGLEIREAIHRNYPLHENGAQVFGYVSEISKKQIPIFNEKFKSEIKFEQGDIIGKSGLEGALEREIRGIDGISFLQVDARGREAVTQTPDIFGQKIQDKEPIPGYNVTLTLDKDVQEAAFKSMADNKRIGAVVAMQTNGEILAWVNTPSFDPNEFAVGIAPEVWSKIINDPYKPLRDKAIQDHTSPGSTFKPFMAIAALQEKVVNPSQIIYCPGAINFGKRLYHDHLKNGHGNITIYDALERSSNVFFYKMGIGLGIDKMSAYAKAFGLGQKTGVEVDNEVAGLIPTPDWKKKEIGEEWQPGENLSTVIGQGFVLVTPIQLARAYNAIGNGGKLYKPFVVKKIVNHENVVLKEFSEKLTRDLSEPNPDGVKIDASTFDVVQEGLRRVANGERGTAKWWKIPGVQMAGKTGTSQVMSFSADQIYSKCETNPMHMRHHGWFIGYAPADNPLITVAVLAEHACHGSTGAAPIVRDVIKAYIEKYHPELIEQGLHGAHNKPASPSTTPSNVNKPQEQESIDYE